MPTPTYTPLANLTLGSSAASCTFSSISQSYKDLVLVATGASGTSGAQIALEFNADTGSNYFFATMEGDAGTAIGNIDSYMGYIKTSVSAGPIRPGEMGSMIANIMDYSTTKHKAVLVRTDNGIRATVACEGRWASTSAITSIKVRLTNSQSWAAGSTFALYGIVG